MTSALFFFTIFAFSFFTLIMSTFNSLLKTYTFPLFFAPMEEVSDASFRKICKNFGADFLISEFVSSEALIRDVPKSFKKLAFSEEERPFGIQIFGHDENSLIQAAQIAESLNPTFIDINWGCPVKKVVTKGAGSAILKDIPKMIALTKSVVDAVDLPVTVKTRLGWDHLNKPIVEIAEKLQDIGIQALTVHGRTRSQIYSGEADWTLIGEIKNNSRMIIPIIGNGDITSGAKALEYKSRYGVDAIMIGRAAIGNPWIFQEVKNFAQNIPFTPPTFHDRIKVCLQHLTSAAQLKGEITAVLEMRRHYAGYFKAIPHFKDTKMKLMMASSVDEVIAILQSKEFESLDSQ